MTERETFHPHAMLDAALAGDAEHARQLASRMGTSMRAMLYQAGWQMLNAIAGAEANLDRLRSYARNLSMEARAILEGLAASGPKAVSMSAVTANALRVGGLTDANGITDDGREVLRLLEIDAMLAKTRDCALSDEDMDHEGGPPAPRSSDRVRGMWPR